MIKMRCLSVGGFMVACLLFVSVTVDCGKLEERFKELKAVVVSRGLKTEPIEMYYALKDLKSARMNCDTDVGYLGGAFHPGNFDQDLDDLIEAFNIHEGKCNSEGFAKLRNLLQHLETRENLVYYLLYVKSKLGEFCLNLPTNVGA